MGGVGDHNDPSYRKISDMGDRKEIPAFVQSFDPEAAGSETAAKACKGGVLHVHYRDCGIFNGLVGAGIPEEAPDDAVSLGMGLKLYDATQEKAGNEEKGAHKGVFS